MKSLWKWCKVAMCICLLFAGLLSVETVHAEDNEIQPRMTYIYSYSANLSISSDGTATITGKVTGKSGVTSTYVKVTLQKSVSGSWTDVESWSDSNSSRSTIVSETYQVSKGTYRVVMTCSANGETKTATSAEKTY